MKIRSQTFTALRALLDLCLHASSQTPASLSEIAKRQGLSVAFLEQLFRRLKGAGLVAPWRGMKGGYTLAKAPDQISLWDVFSSLADPLVQKQQNPANANAAEEQSLRQVFVALEHKWEKDLKQVKLSDLREETLKNPKMATAPREGVRFQI